MHDGIDPDDPARTSALTLAAYERGAAEWTARTPARPSVLVAELVGRLPVGAEVLELGSGPGRGADELEAAGLTVRPTDGAGAFVDRLRAAGRAARILDVHAPDYGGQWDAVLADAVLLHVARTRLTGVLEVARRAVRPGGLLAASFKLGDGAGWSDRKLGEPRHFTYWRQEELTGVVIRAGWTPLLVAERTPPDASERWIVVVARNDPDRDDVDAGAVVAGSAG